MTVFQLRAPLALTLIAAAALAAGCDADSGEPPFILDGETPSQRVSYDNGYMMNGYMMNGYMMK